MPRFNEFDNRMLMMKWMVLPNGPDEVLASFIAPHIPVQIRRGENQCAVFWYALDSDLGLFRERADAWERENARRRQQSWKVEYEATWAKRLAEMDMTEPKLW